MLGTGYGDGYDFVDGAWSEYGYVLCDEVVLVAVYYMCAWPIERMDDLGDAVG